MLTPERSISTVRRSTLLVLLLPAAFFFALSLAAFGETTPEERGPDYATGRLVGTLEGGPFTGAVFEHTDGTQTFYRMGVTFSDGTRIVEVRPKSVTVRAGDGTLLEYRVTGGAPGGPLEVRPPGPPDAQDPDAGHRGRSRWTGGLEGREPVVRRSPPGPGGPKPGGRAGGQNRHGSEERNDGDQPDP